MKTLSLIFTLLLTLNCYASRVNILELEESSPSLRTELDCHHIDLNRLTFLTDDELLLSLGSCQSYHEHKTIKFITASSIAGLTLGRIGSWYMGTSGAMTYVGIIVSPLSMPITIGAGMSIDTYAERSTEILERRDALVDELETRGLEIILSGEFEDRELYEEMTLAP